MSRLRTILSLSIFLALFATTAGCGSEGFCNGSSCECPSGMSCSFGAVDGTCRFDCAAGSTCTGTCTGRLVANCNGTDCTMSGSADSVLDCVAGTCHFSCAGACTAQCGSGCTLTCGGGTTQSPAGCS